MTILTWPGTLPPPSRLRLGLVANTQSGGKSPFDGTEQTLELPGARWGAELSWDGLDTGEWRGMAAFVAKLGGRAGRFTWGPPAMGRRGAGAVASSISVWSGGATGAAIQTQGWVFPAGPSFLAGDWIGWNDPTGRPQLHLVTDDCGPGPGGFTGVPIAPPIRRSPNAGAAVTFSPTAVWRLGEDDNPFDFEGDTVIGAVTLTFVEAIF